MLIVSAIGSANAYFIYIYAFSRRFYPKGLTIAFRLYIFLSVLWSLGIEPTTFCTANAMLSHWATQEHNQWTTDYLKKLMDYRILEAIFYLLFYFF